MELTDVPAGVSECVLQDPSQTALWGRTAHPGVYQMRQPYVKDLQGVTHKPAGDQLRSGGLLGCRGTVTGARANYPAA